MARAFAGHPAVVGWQIDNEIRGHQKNLRFAPSCHAFVEQVVGRKRYGDD